MNEMKTHKILWTGGWDSTYRIVELSRMDVQVQPIYILDEDRTSHDRELQCMERIVAMLKIRPETRAEFTPILIVKKSDIPANLEITKAYDIIHEKTHLGTQHEWLARYAFTNPGLEIGTEAGTPETSHIIDALQNFACLVERDGTFILDPGTSSREGMLVLGNFEFPIVDKYETQMLQNIRDWGYEDVMQEIWFCHRPIDGKPCGLCHPCAVKMESDMAWLLPKEAQKRYRFQKRLSKVIGIRYAEAVAKRIWKRGQIG